MMIEEQVIDCIKQVFENKGKKPPSIALSDKLDRDFGLDSLDYAELVVRLEQQFGKDPFSEGTPGEIQTVLDLASLYK